MPLELQKAIPTTSLTLVEFLVNCLSSTIVLKTKAPLIVFNLFVSIFTYVVTMYIPVLWDEYILILIPKCSGNKTHLHILL